MRHTGTIQCAAQKPQDGGQPEKNEQQPQQGSNTCHHCLGVGRVPTKWGTGKRQRTKTCMYCRGTGKLFGGGGYLTK